jgi:hypothetical protein
MVRILGRHNGVGNESEYTLRAQEAQARAAAATARYRALLFSTSTEPVATPGAITLARFEALAAAEQAEVFRFELTSRHRSTRSTVRSM